MTNSSSNKNLTTIEISTTKNLSNEESAHAALAAMEAFEEINQEFIEEINSLVSSSDSYNKKINPKKLANTAGIKNSSSFDSVSDSVNNSVNANLKNGAEAPSKKTTNGQNPESFEKEIGDAKEEVKQQENLKAEAKDTGKLFTASKATTMECQGSEKTSAKENVVKDQEEASFSYPPKYLLSKFRKALSDNQSRLTAANKAYACYGKDKEAIDSWTVETSSGSIITLTRSKGDAGNREKVKVIINGVEDKEIAELLLAKRNHSQEKSSDRLSSSQKSSLKASKKLSKATAEKDASSRNKEEKDSSQTSPQTSASFAKQANNYEQRADNSLRSSAEKASSQEPLAHGDAPTLSPIYSVGILSERASQSSSVLEVSESLDAFEAYASTEETQEVSPAYRSKDSLAFSTDNASFSEERLNSTKKEFSQGFASQVVKESSSQEAVFVKNNNAESSTSSDNDATTDKSTDRNRDSASVLNQKSPTSSAEKVSKAKQASSLKNTSQYSIFTAPNNSQGSTTQERAKLQAPISTENSAENARTPNFEQEASEENKSRVENLRNQQLKLLASLTENYQVPEVTERAAQTVSLEQINAKVEQIRSKTSLRSPYFTGAYYNPEKTNFSSAKNDLSQALSVRVLEENEKDFDVYALIRFSNEVTTLKQCLNSLLPTINKGVLVTHRTPDGLEDDGSLAVALEFVAKNPGFKILFYPHVVYHANHPIYNNLQLIERENYLDAYTEFGIQAIKDLALSQGNQDPWLIKLDADHIYDSQLLASQLEEIMQRPNAEEEVHYFAKLDVHYDLTSGKLYYLRTQAKARDFLVKAKYVQVGMHINCFDNTEKVGIFGAVTKVSYQANKNFRVGSSLAHEVYRFMDKEPEQLTFKQSLQAIHQYLRYKLVPGTAKEATQPLSPYDNNEIFEDRTSSARAFAMQNICQIKANPNVYINSLHFKYLKYCFEGAGSLALTGIDYKDFLISQEYLDLLALYPSFALSSVFTNHQLLLDYCMEMDFAGAYKHQQLVDYYATCRKLGELTYE